MKKSISLIILISFLVINSVFAIPTAEGLTDPSFEQWTGDNLDEWIILEGVGSEIRKSSFNRSGSWSVGFSLYELPDEFTIHSFAIGQNITGIVGGTNYLISFFVNLNIGVAGFQINFDFYDENDANLTDTNFFQCTAPLGTWLELNSNDWYGSITAPSSAVKMEIWIFTAIYGYELIFENGYIDDASVSGTFAAQELTNPIILITTSVTIITTILTIRKRKTK